jgi:hypothetical protein
MAGQSCAYECDEHYLVAQEDRKRHLCRFPYMKQTEKHGTCCIGPSSRTWPIYAQD